MHRVSALLSSSHVGASSGRWVCLLLHQLQCKRNILELLCSQKQRMPCQAVRQLVFPFGENSHLTLCLTSLALSPPHSFHPCGWTWPKIQQSKSTFCLATVLHSNCLGSLESPSILFLATWNHDSLDMDKEAVWCQLVCSPVGHLIGSCHVSRSAAELWISYQLFCKEKLAIWKRSCWLSVFICEGHAASIHERHMTEHTGERNKGSPIYTCSLNFVW